MKDNLSTIKNIKWYNIAENGCIEGHLKNEAAVYIFMNLNTTRIYIGSSINLSSRLSKHKSDINKVGNKFKDGCPLFYNSVKKYGWNSFKFGILEYMDISKIADIKIIKNIILEKEQYYLDNVNPSLNILKIADSPLGVKRNAMFSINLSAARRGKNCVQPPLRNKADPAKSDTILKIASRCKGVKVKVYDKSNNLLKEYTTITSAAKALGVHNTTVRNIRNTGISYDNYIYKFEIKINKPIMILNKKENICKKYSSIREAAKDIGVSPWSVTKYLNTNKLLKNNYLISK